MTPNEAGRYGLPLNRDGQRRTAFELLAYPDVALADLAKIWPQLLDIDPAIATHLEIEAKYDVYVSRQAEDIEALRRDESLKLGEAIDYAAVTGLSNEARQRLEAARPATIGQASRMDGMTPAALTLLIAHLRRKPRASKASSRLRPCRRGRRSPWRRRLQDKRQFGAGQADLAADKRAALKLCPVSRETEERLDRYVALLREWQPKTNLVAPSTLPSIWTRHVADSLQLLDLAPSGRSWIDLGSGGGFPGIVLACALADQHDAAVHLVERNAKKAAFLREALRVTGGRGTVHLADIENFVDSNPPAADYITARALAPLNVLLGLAAPLIARGAKALFLKGPRCRG